MAKGSESKELFYKKILETFNGSFLYNGNKEIRIPMIENGELIQLKVSVVCAKENVNMGNAETQVIGSIEPKVAASGEITEEEKKEVVDLIKLLQL